MKFWKRYGKGFLALILAVAMVGGIASVPGVFAEENNTQAVADDTAKEASLEEDAASEDAAISDAENETAEDMEIESAPVVYTEDGVQVQADEETAQVFNLSVTFEGTELNADASKNTDFSWKSANDTSAKTMQVTLKRNKNVSAESGKNYVVCMKVPQAFYFSGLPDASKINGVEEVTIVKNECPQVNLGSGNPGNLEGFSAYSGEIRLRLNPAVEEITITDIGINYNKALIGYTGGSQTVKNPVSVSLVSVDNTKGLGDFSDTDATKLVTRQVGAVSITTGSNAGPNFRTAMSLNAFQTTGVNESDLNLGKSSQVSYSYSTQGQPWQVYQTLTVVYHCPYITYENQKYYLDFVTNDPVFTSNTTSSGKKGYKMSRDAEYNASEHTITYSFENIYLGSYTGLFYTPQFSWPSELTDKKIAIGTKYKIEGGNWEIKEQTCFTGATSSLKNADNASRTAYYIPDQVDVTLTSSAQATNSQKIAKRHIYQGITRENKVPGTLGFFDVHNDGALDSPEVNIEFVFNTDIENDQATYYVTKVRLPVYGNSGGVDVSYTLIDSNKKEVLGTIHYNNTSSFNCEVESLRTNSSVGDDYYIKDLSYQTKLQRGTAYHIETAHLYRNRMDDCGLFWGYLEGDLNTSAHATMSISAVDGKTAINTSDKSSLSSTEMSTVWDEDYIACGLSEMSVNGDKNSTSITAGDSLNLQFGAQVSTEEYHKDNQAGNEYVNGYHVLRDGVFYLCLPDGVSIPGTEQITIKAGGKTVQSKEISMEQLTGTSCTVNGVPASWWKIQADNINVTSGGVVSVDVRLATKLAMDGLSWDFKNNVVVRAKGQYVSWNAATDKASVYNTTTAMNSTSSTSIKALSTYLNSQKETTDLGLCVYNANNVTKMTIARAEAKLDVQTGIEVGTSTVDQAAVSISDADTDLAYNVTVSSKDGGHADNFEYYIPIVSTDSAIDANMLVAQNEFGLKLQAAASVTKIGDASADETETVSSEIPFTVYYTTEKNLTSANIRTDSTIEWKTVAQLNNDFSAVTAVKIVTNENALIKDGESFNFKLPLKYDNAASDFEQMAGSVVEWRSFGHYTYKRDDATAETTNSYPSQVNRVTIAYSKDLTTDSKNDMVALLDTSATNNVVHKSLDLTNTFKKQQTFEVKKVQPSSGLQLISDDPIDLTGTKANTQFQVTFNMNDGTAALLTEKGTAANKKWTVGAGGSITLQGEVKFSQALTDIVTQRYIDVTIGNENVDLTFRIRLDRKVKAATAVGSGVTDGANYQVPTVSTAGCTIGQKSAFTALYVLDFTPGNYKNQVIKWQDNQDTDLAFPAKTNITMMEVTTSGDESTVNSFWYYQTTGRENSIDLSSFRRMSGNENYSYNMSATTSQKVTYMFVVDFSQATTTTGIYQFAWESDPKGDSDSAVEPLSYAFPVNLQTERTYSLSSTETAGLVPQATISYAIGDAKNDSYVAHRSLSLVLQPTESTALPKDAKLKCGDQEYTRNSDGNYIVPIENFTSRSKDLSLVSDMFPDKKMNYSFTAQLYLAESTVNGSPMNGIQVGKSLTVNFRKSAQVRPALCVTGKRIGTVSDWANGQKLTIQLKNIADGQMTVTAYSGLTGTQQATDLLSSVAGMFNIDGAVGTYKESSTTGLLKLSSNAQPGTYRLVFEVKDADGKSVMEVPYYIIVK